MARKGLPDFETRAGYPRRVLPEGVHPCDETAFKSRFVTGFPQSTKRKGICTGFFQFRADSTAHGFSATQWIDGSFVEENQDPNDVDVVTFVDFDWLISASSDAQEFAKDVLDGRNATKAKYSTHAFSFPACPQDHAYYPYFERARRYWREWLGRTYDKSHPAGKAQPRYSKGFVSMVMGDVTRAPHVSTEGSK